MKFLIILLLVGCAQDPIYITEYKQIDLMSQMPNRPILTPIRSDKLKCLDDGAYKNIVENTLNLKHYAMQLENIINSTHEVIK